MSSALRLPAVFVGPELAKARAPAWSVVDVSRCDETGHYFFRFDRDDLARHVRAELLVTWTHSHGVSFDGDVVVLDVRASRELTASIEAWVAANQSLVIAVAAEVSP